VCDGHSTAATPATVRVCLHRIYKHKPTHAIVQCSACYGHE